MALAASSGTVDTFSREFVLGSLLLFFARRHGDLGRFRVLLDRFEVGDGRSHGFLAEVDSVVARLHLVDEGGHLLDQRVAVGLEFLESLALRRSLLGLLCCSDRSFLVSQELVPGADQLGEARRGLFRDVGLERDAVDRTCGRGVGRDLNGGGHPGLLSKDRRGKRDKGSKR